MTPRFIIIHCTDVSWHVSKHQFDSVNRYHRDVRLFPKSTLGYYVGYHRMSSGGIEYKAREDFEIGAHCNEVVNGLSMNMQGLGYCIAFDGDVEYPLEADVVNLVKTVRAWMDVYNISEENIKLHRQYSISKTCPGALVDREYFLSRIRGSVRQKDEEQLEKQKKIQEFQTALDRIRATLAKLIQQLQLVITQKRS